MERIYESMLIVRPDISDAEREEVFQKISKKITDLEGKVNASKIWAKERQFCYILRNRGAEKKKFDKGCYWLLYFTLDTNKLGELKDAFKLEERILRNIVIKKDGKVAADMIEGS